MRRRNLLTLAFTGIMAAVLLSGCGGGSSQEAGESAQADASGKTVIKIWSKDRHDAAFIQNKIDAYNQTNTDNVQVSYELYTDNFQQAVDLAVQSGELPDILKLNDQVYNQYVNQGQWLDLYQYMDDDMKEYFKDEVYEGINEIDGKLYYIPTCGTTGRLIYNKEIFERVGVSYRITCNNGNQRPLINP